MDNLVMNPATTSYSWFWIDSDLQNLIRSFQEFSILSLWYMVNPHFDGRFLDDETYCFSFNFCISNLSNNIEVMGNKVSTVINTSEIGWQWKLFVSNTFTFILDTTPNNMEANQVHAKKNKDKQIHKNNNHRQLTEFLIQV